MKGVFWNSQHFKSGLILAQQPQLIKMILPYLAQTLQVILFAWTMCSLGILNSSHARNKNILSAHKMIFP